LQQKVKNGGWDRKNRVIAGLSPLKQGPSTPFGKPESRSGFRRRVALSRQAQGYARTTVEELQFEQSGKARTSSTEAAEANESMDSSIIRQLRKIAGKDAVLDRPEELMLYEYDAGVDKHRPGAVVFAQTTQQVSQVMKLASDKKIPVVPRGAGTGLSGGAIARREAIVLSLARMNKILEIDVPNQRAVVQPGLVNLELSNATTKFGY
jgi:hypothetical protein